MVEEATLEVRGLEASVEGKPILKGIECPKHGSTFDLNTGKPRSLPATLPVETFAVTTENDDILIEVTNGE